MIEFRWVGRQLQFRHRFFEVDASGSFCGLTDFGPWNVVPELEVGEPEVIERDAAEAAADELSSLILGEPIDWPDHHDAWMRAADKCRAIGRNAELHNESE